jgi:predicted GH43/DUF377 family glycosyl hydrolase
MFYNGSQQPHIFGYPLYIGYATSHDGYNFQKSPVNPILTGDGSGFDAWQVTKAVLMVQDSIWIMYYCGREIPGIGPGRKIGRATAPHPDSTWARLDTAVIKPGEAGDWDSGFIAPQSVLESDTGLVMYYMAGDGQDFQTADTLRIGLATSTDGGYTWKKYDNPLTMSPPYEHSDPVLQPGPPGSWERRNVADCEVIKTGDKYEMFYTGSYRIGVTWFASIGYAWSDDGIHWIKDSVNNPIFTVQDDSLTSGWVEAPTVIIIDSLYFMYYFDSTWSFTNLATAPVTGPPVFVADNEDKKIPAGFNLKQNYPNPFNPTTTIEFSLPKPSSVTLEVYNILGEKVATLVSENLSAGTYQYIWEASGLPNGVYFYRIEIDQYMLVKKALLVK